LVSVCINYIAADTLASSSALNERSSFSKGVAVHDFNAACIAVVVFLRPAMQTPEFQRRFFSEKISISGINLHFVHKCFGMYEFYAIICEISYYYMFF